MVEQIEDKYKCILIPNESVSIFKLGEKISTYSFLEFSYTPKDEIGAFNDSYDFKEIPICVWTDEDTNLVIETIRCDVSCLWGDRELIGMAYNDFLEIYQL